MAPRSIAPPINGSGASSSRSTIRAGAGSSTTCSFQRSLFLAARRGAALALLPGPGGGAKRRCTGSSTSASKSSSVTTQVWRTFASRWPETSSHRSRGARRASGLRARSARANHSLAPAPRIPRRSAGGEHPILRGNGGGLQGPRKGKRPSFVSIVFIHRAILVFRAGAAARTHPRAFRRPLAPASP